MDFFYKEYTNKVALNRYPTQIYLIIYTNKVLKSQQINGDICLHLSPESERIFLLQHYFEQFQYFKPDTQKNYEEPNYHLSDSEIFTLKSTNMIWILLILELIFTVRAIGNSAVQIETQRL